MIVIVSDCQFVPCSSSRVKIERPDFNTRMQLERGSSICIVFSLAMTHWPMTVSISSKGVYLFSPLICRNHRSENQTRRACKSVWFHSRFFSVPTAENKTPFDNMAQRLTYRRRLSYNTRSNRVKVYVRRHCSSGIVRTRISFQCQNTRW